MKDDAWWAREKFDGKRVLVRKGDDKVTGINRKGLVIDLPVPIIQAVQSLDARRCLLDGEAIGDTFIAFDLLQEATLELAAKPYLVRYAHLVDLVDSIPSDSIRYAQTATTRAQKLTMLDRLRQERQGRHRLQAPRRRVRSRPACQWWGPIKAEVHGHGLGNRRRRRRQPAQREAGIAGWSPAGRRWQRHHPCQSSDSSGEPDRRSPLSLRVPRRKPVSTGLSGQEG